MASASDVAARAISPVDVVPLPCTSPPLYSSAVMARSMYSRSPSGSVHTALPRTGSRNPASSPYPVTRHDHADVGEIAPERSGQLRQHLGADHALGARLSPGQERGDIAAHQVREQAMGHGHYHQQTEGNHPCRSCKHNSDLFHGSFLPDGYLRPRRPPPKAVSAPPPVSRRVGETTAALIRHPGALGGATRAQGDREAKSPPPWWPGRRASCHSQTADSAVSGNPKAKSVIWTGFVTMPVLARPAGAVLLISAGMTSFSHTRAKRAVMSST